MLIFFIYHFTFLMSCIISRTPLSWQRIPWYCCKYRPRPSMLKVLLDGIGMLSRRIPAQCQSDVGLQLTVKTQGLTTMAPVHGTMLRQHHHHTNNASTILLACTGEPSGETRCKAANNTWYMSSVDGTSLARGKMPVFQCHRPYSGL